MEEVVKRDILTVLREVIIIIKDEDYGEIKELSNHIIHNASIFQDPDSVAAAVIIYSLSKIMERSAETRKKISKSIVHTMNDAIDLLEKGRTEEYRKAASKIIKTISEHDGRLHFFIEEVVKQAQIKKGSKISEHGISVAHAAQMMGISQWELMNYIGKTTIAEYGPVNVDKRLAFAIKLFGGKR